MQSNKITDTIKPWIADYDEDTEEETEVNFDEDGDVITTKTHFWRPSQQKWSKKVPTGIGKVASAKSDSLISEFRADYKPRPFVRSDRLRIGSFQVTGNRVRDLERTVPLRPDRVLLSALPLSQNPLFTMTLIVETEKEHG